MHLDARPQGLDLGLLVVVLHGGLVLAAEGVDLAEVGEGVYHVGEGFSLDADRFGGGGGGVGLLLR